MNANDDNNNGWSNANPPGPNSTYTPDYEDNSCPGGDPDLQMFRIDLYGFDEGDPRGTVTLTYSEANIKVFKNGDKSTLIASDTEFTMDDMTEVFRDELGGSAYVILYAEGISFSLEVKDCFINAEYDGPMNLIRQNDHVDVTVFGGINSGKYDGAQYDDDEVRFFVQGRNYNYSDNKDGKWSWTNEAKCGGVHNCMEHQIKVLPTNYITKRKSNSEFADVAPVSFDMSREKYGNAWTKASAIAAWVADPAFTTTWQDDNIDNTTKDLVLSDSSNIYYVDAPGYRNCFNGPNLPPVVLPYQAEHFADFRNIGLINLYGKWYQFTLYYTWHSQVITKTVTVGNRTGLDRSAAAQQKLGAGWIAIPGAAEEPI